MAKSKRSSWRVQGDIGKSFIQLEDIGRDGFDELVVERKGVCMIHVERMDWGSYYVALGNMHIDIWLGRDGKVHGYVREMGDVEMDCHPTKKSRRKGRR